MAKKPIEGKRTGDDSDENLREARERRWDAERNDFLNCPPSREFKTDGHLADDLESVLASLQLFTDSDGPILTRNFFRKAEEAINNARIVRAEFRLLYPVDPQNKPEAARMLADMILWLRSQLPAELVELLAYTEAELKGQQAALVKALISSGGKLSIPEFAAQNTDWSERWQDDYSQLQREVNKKTKTKGYQINRKDNEARLTPIPKTEEKLSDS